MALFIGSQRLTSRIKGINIDTQVHRLRGPNSVFDLLDDTFCADRINLPGFNNLKATIAIILVV